MPWPDPFLDDLDCLLRAQLVEIVRDFFQVGDKGIGARPAELILKRIDKQQHKRNHWAHRGREVADYSQLGLEMLALMTYIQWNTAKTLIGPNRILRVEGAFVAALLS